jgi:predicted Fe-Mo cluster-binding NifX family protein
MRLSLLTALIILMPWISSAQRDVIVRGRIIAIPATEKDIDARIDLNFSRCSFFCIYNVETGSITFVENKHKDAAGGASRQVVQFLMDNGVNEIFAVKTGPNAQRQLDRFKIGTKLVPSGKTIGQLTEGIK